MKKNKKVYCSNCRTNLGSSHTDVTVMKDMFTGKEWVILIFVCPKCKTETLLAEEK